MSEVRDLAEVKVMLLDELKPAPGNPRRIPAQAVEIVGESLRRFGWQQPLVVDRDLVLIVGHTRWQAAKQLGLTQAPVVVAENLSDDEVRAYRIADNRTHDFTSWDYPALTAELDALAGDFSDVLALEDWQTIVAEFESADQAPDVPADVQANASLDGFTISIVFGTKQEALAQEQALLDLPGVLDVRHKLT